MNKLLSVVAATFMLAASTYAAPFSNVTVFDGIGNTTGEDNEMDAGSFEQYQEVEAFLFNGTDISLVGGYDFQNGYTWGQTHITTGDIFVDLGRDGTYDLALEFDFDNLLYNVIEVIDEIDVTYKDHGFASPFKAIGNFIGAGTLVYETGLTNAQVGFGLIGGNHNRVTMLGVNAFGIESNFGLHYTMLCGNDVAKAEVPEPTLLSLLGIGILGLSFTRRKKHS